MYLSPKTMILLVLLTVYVAVFGGEYKEDAVFIFASLVANCIISGMRYVVNKDIQNGIIQGSGMVMETQPGTGSTIYSKACILLSGLGTGGLVLYVLMRVF